MGENTRSELSEKASISFGNSELLDPFWQTWGEGSKMGRGAQIIAFLLATGWLCVCTQQAGAQDKAGSTGADWPSHGGTGSAWRYSALDQINTSNVKKLTPAWIFQTGDYQDGLQSTPIVVNGVLYLAAFDDVFALDGATGNLIWQYKYEPLSGFAVGRNFGVAVGDGKVFIGTRDAHVVALDQKTGQEVWKVAADDAYSCRCTIQAAPLVAGHEVVVAEGGPRGRLTAFDTETGHLAWRFYVVPGAGEKGVETWANDSWKKGGSNMWTTGSFDPNLKLIYWGTGDPSGAWNYQGDTKFAELYSDSILALDVDTGKLRWYYQEIPHDVWDQDGSWELLLMDRPVNGKMRKLLVQFAKAGYTFILDRETGELLNVYPYAESNNWVKSISPTGELIGRNDPAPGKTTNICPNVGGAKNWNQVAYSPRTSLVYVPVVEMCNDLTLPPSVNGQTVGATWVFTAPPGHASAYTHLDAVDPVSGKRQWTYPYRFQIFASILATAGDLMFTGDPEGNFFALDARSGEKLWSFQTGAGNRGSPVTYTVDGRQYIANPTGMGHVAFYNSGVWPEVTTWRYGSALVVFALPKESK
jgi:alcohol dehydrogenase (cytochrome c)